MSIHDNLAMDQAQKYFLENSSWLLHTCKQVVFTYHCFLFFVCLFVFKFIYLVVFVWVAYILQKLWLASIIKCYCSINGISYLNHVLWDVFMSKGLKMHLTLLIDSRYLVLTLGNMGRTDIQSTKMDFNIAKQSICYVNCL